MTSTGLKSDFSVSHQALFKESQQILQGLELIYPNERIIPRVRFLVEKLYRPDFARNDVLEECFVIFKELGDYPITSSLESLLCSVSLRDQMVALLSLLHHLTDNVLAERIRQAFKCFSVDQQAIEELRTSVITILSDYENDPIAGHIISLIKSTYLERDKLVSLKKLSRIYLELYDDPIFDRFRKLAEHFLTLKSDLEIYNFLRDVTKIRLIDRIKVCRQNFPEERLFEALSKGQVQSKLWAMQELWKVAGPEVRRVELMCGWYGLLPLLMHQKIGGHFHLESVDCYDLDANCAKVFDALSAEASLDFRFHALDVNEVTLQASQGLCVINTSCEHLANFNKWYSKIPQGTLILLQSNDFFDHPEHVNCVTDLESFVASAPMERLLFKGELPLEKYTRFMLIGYI